MLIACDSVTRIGSVCTAYIHVSNVAQETIVKATATLFNIDGFPVHYKSCALQKPHPLGTCRSHLNLLQLHYSN
jgi:hypothetical protein